ncbi:MAG: glycosyltransferase family 9 protein [Ignavibacteriales bacterium]|nr:glycosyltransferase family 9 protein [Ignavibacteriales bacterium]
MFKRDYFLINKFFKSIRFLLAKRKRNSNKILIISFKLLGDTILTIPAIKYLKNNFPDKDITIFCFEESKVLYNIAFTDISYETFAKNEINLDSIFVNLKVLKKIWKQKPEFIIDFTSGLFTALILLLSSSKINIGFNLQIFGCIYDCFLTKKKEPHLVDMYADPIKKYLHQESVRTDYYFPTVIIPEGTILLNPFAGWKAKEWGIKKYFELGLRLKLEYNIKFVMAQNSLLKDFEIEFYKEKIDIIFTKNINELICEINKSILLISNDSGPIHIAAFLGKPTFSIYGPTNPSYSIPKGKNHNYVQKILKCSSNDNEQYCFTNAGRNGCSTNECMNLLTVEDVTVNLIKFIKELGIKAKY